MQRQLTRRSTRESRRSTYQNLDLMDRIRKAELTFLIESGGEIDAIRVFEPAELAAIFACIESNFVGFTFTRPREQVRIKLPLYFIPTRDDVNHFPNRLAATSFTSRSSDTRSSTHASISPSTFSYSVQRYEYEPRAPKSLPYAEDVPPGYVAVERIRLGWLIAGSSVFAGSYLYLLAMFSVVSTSSEKDGIMFLPGVGPIIFAAQESSDGSAFVVATLALDGVLQFISGAVALWAALDPKKLLLREDLAVLPFVGANGGGLGVTARF